MTQLQALYLARSYRAIGVEAKASPVLNATEHQIIFNSGLNYVDHKTAIKALSAMRRRYKPDNSIQQIGNIIALTMQNLEPNISLRRAS